MNEPWPGDIYSDPELLIAKNANEKNLQVFYDEIFMFLNNKNYLKNKLFLFEPITWSELGSHFKNPCLNSNDNSSNQCVLSYHCYFPPQISVDQTFKSRLRDMEQMNTAGFLTEVGSDRLHDIFERLDESFQSVSVWTYKRNAGITGDGSMFFNKNGSNESTRLLLNRTYPRAICGHGKYFNFNVTANTFVLIYENNNACTGMTEIFLNGKMNISISPESEYFISNSILYVYANSQNIDIKIVGDH